MKTIFFVTLLYGTHALADCRCIAKQGGRTLLDTVSTETTECQNRIGDSLFQRYLNGDECKSAENIDIQWGCGNGGVLQPKSFICQEFKDRLDAESTLNVAFATKDLLNTDWSLDPAENCEEDARDLPPGAFITTFESDEETVQALTEIGLLKDHSQEEILRLIREEGPVSFEIHKIKKPASDGRKELPLTISFKEERNGATSMMVDHLAGNKSNMEVSSKHKFSLTNIDTFYLEERVDKVIIQSAERNRAFFWRAEGGLHKIYGTNDGNGRLLTRTNEILEFHRLSHPPRPQILHQGDKEGRPEGYFLGGEIGASVEEALSKNAAILATVSLESRATTLENMDASYGGVKGALQGTYKLKNGNAVRAGVEIQGRKFLNGEKSVVYTARVGIGNKKWDCEVRATIGDRSPIPDLLLPKRSGAAVRTSCGLKW